VERRKWVDGILERLYLRLVIYRICAGGMTGEGTILGPYGDINIPLAPMYEHSVPSGSWYAIGGLYLPVSTEPVRALGTQYTSGLPAA
jgi:hypothetical protein